MRWLSSALVALVATAVHTVDAVWPANVKLEGLNYDTQTCKSPQDEAADLEAIARISKSVRVYSVTLKDGCTMPRLLQTAKSKGLTVSLGMWLSNVTKFDSQYYALEELLKQKAIDSNVIGFHVGSEAIYRGDYTASDAITYVKKTRELFNRYGVPMKITVADVIDAYYNHPALLDAVDYVSLNQFSFWEGNGFDPNMAMQKMLDRIRSIRAQALRQNKEVLISETGWASGGVDPSKSSGVGSIANQRTFFTNFYHQITAHRIPYYWFVAYDAPDHKSEKTVEKWFGVMEAYSRKIKESYATVDFTPRAITTLQSSRGVLAETYNANAPDVVDGVELAQQSSDKLARFRSQWFWDSGKMQLRSLNSDRCLDAYQPQDGGIVHTYACSETNANQQWVYNATTQQLQHAVHAGFCLEDRVNAGKIQLWKCSTSNANQRWSMVAPAQLTCPAAEQGIDYVGNDVGSAKSASANGCCAICIANAFCNAFTWTNHEGGTCWLKSGKGQVTGSFGAYSAQVTLAPPTTPPPSTTAPPPTTTTPTTTTPTTTAPSTTAPPTLPPTTNPAACSATETNVDYIGNDVANKPSAKPDGCCELCKATTGCKAFTWSDYNGGTCWLKNGKGTTATKVGVVSAVVNTAVTVPPTTTKPPVTTAPPVTTKPPTTTAPPTVAPGACPAIEEGVDYVGLDVANAYSPTAEGCCALCRSNAACYAFSWTNYNGGTCWLKSGKGTTTSKSGVRSAVVRSPCSVIEENVDYTGNDLASKPSAPAAKAEDCCGVCRATSGCRAYTWTNYNGGTCWLKSGKGAAATKGGARSATVA